MALLLVNTVFALSCQLSERDKPLAIQKAKVEQMRPIVRTEPVLKPLKLCGLTASHWELVPDASRITFLTMSAQRKVTNHSIPVSSGGIGAKGATEFTVDLLAAAEHVKPLYHWLKPSDGNKGAGLATITTELQSNSLAQVAYLELGRNIQSRASYELAFNGIGESRNINTNIQCLGATRLEIKTGTPFVVHANSFGLAQNIQALRDELVIEHMSEFVPVDFTLTFERSQGDAPIIASN